MFNRVFFYKDYDHNKMMLEDTIRRRVRFDQSSLDAVALKRRWEDSFVDMLTSKQKHYLVSKKHIISDFKKHHFELGNLCEFIILENDVHKKFHDLDVFRSRILMMLGGSLDKYELYW